MWVQEKNASKEIKYGKVPSKDNPADLFTKFLSGDEIDKHMAAMSFEFKAGHDAIALTINSLEKDFGDLEEASKKRDCPIEETKKKRLVRAKAKRWP